MCIITTRSNRHTPQLSHTPTVQIYLPFQAHQNALSKRPASELGTIQRNNIIGSSCTTHTRQHYENYTMEPYISSSEYTNMVSNFPLIFDIKKGRNHKTQKRTVSSISKESMPYTNSTFAQLREYTKVKPSTAVCNKSFTSTREATRSSYCYLPKKANLNKSFYLSTNPYVKIKSSIVKYIKYKAVVKKKTDGLYVDNDAIGRIENELYQSRYIMYVNNHNILNSMKRFLIDHGKCISAHEITSILRLIDYYEAKLKDMEGSRKSRM